MQYMRVVYAPHDRSIRMFLKSFFTIFVLGSVAATSVHAGEIEKLWNAKCKSCHGKDGKAQTKMGKMMKTADMTTAEWQRKYSDQAMDKTIRKGLKRKFEGATQMMPGYQQFSDEEVAAFIKLIRTWNPEK